MKRISTALALMFALCGVAADAHALEKYMSRTRGNQASFGAWSDTDCGGQYVNVWAFEEAANPNQSYASDVLYVDFYSYDWCTGDSSYGYAQFDGTSFDVQKLKSATADVSATIDVQSCHMVDGGGGGGGGAGAGGSGSSDGGMPWYDYVCESSTESLLIDLTWTATGGIYRDRSNYSYSTPYSRYRSIWSGQSTEATISGVISIGDLDLDVSSGYGSLGYTQSGSFEMYH